MSPAHTAVEIAQKIMGPNFFGLSDAAEHFNLFPTKEEDHVFEHVPFSEHTLYQHRDTHLLAAILPLSIMDMRERMHSPEHPIFYNQHWFFNEPFAREAGHASWELIRRGPVKNSLSKNWASQERLLRQHELIPSARACIYTAIGHFRKSGVYLFDQVYVRCCDTSATGGRVCIGGYGPRGIGICHEILPVSFLNVGLASGCKAA